MRADRQYTTGLLTWSARPSGLPRRHGQRTELLVITAALGLVGVVPVPLAHRAPRGTVLLVGEVAGPPGAAGLPGLHVGRVDEADSGVILDPGQDDELRGERVAHGIGRDGLRELVLSSRRRPSARTSQA